MIPLDVEDITPAWLSEALDADVVSVEVVDRHSGTTGRARIAATYAGGTSLPESLFVKLAPFIHVHIPVAGSNRQKMIVFPSS